MGNVCYLQETILKLFLEINLNLSKPLRMSLSSLIVCLLEKMKHIFRNWVSPYLLMVQVLQLVHNGYGGFYPTERYRLLWRLYRWSIYYVQFSRNFLRLCWQWTAPTGKNAVNTSTSYRLLSVIRGVPYRYFGLF